MDITEFLISNPMFSGFSQPELDALAKALMVERYPDGHVFMKEGQRGDALYMILDGKVSVTRLNRHDRTIEHLHTMMKGELFGLIALIDHGKRTATCTAVGEVTAASLPVSAFELLYDSNVPIAHHFQYLVARQLAHDLRALNVALLDILFGRKESVSRLMHTVPHEFSGPSNRA
jgi:CRP-like cAMP-binding protein